MDAAAVGSLRNRWPLPRILILILAGMYFGLTLDVRVEHVEVVRDKTVAWLPILYAATTALTCLVAFVFWTKLMRRVVLVLFLGSMAVGTTGVYLHSHGKLMRVFHNSVRAWTDPEMNHSDGPPLTAPGAFVGIGLIGALASLHRFSDQT
jgi:hypothetical protein